MAKAKAKKTNGKQKAKRTYSKRKTEAERDRLIRDAIILLRAKHPTKDVAKKLGVKPHWIYYNVKHTVQHRHAA